MSRTSFLVSPWVSPPSKSSIWRSRLIDAGDRLPVGQRATEPAVVDVVLAAALGGFGDVFGGGALGADEQHAAAGGGDVAHGAQRAVQHRHGLLQVDDVDLVADAVQVRRHARVPAAGVVAEMNAGFEQLAHGEFGHRHGRVLSYRPVVPPRGWPCGTGPGKWGKGSPRVNYRPDRAGAADMAGNVSGSKLQPPGRPHGDVESAPQSRG